MSYDDEKAKYREMSDEFVETNREYNRAVADDELTDEIELRFMRSERALKEQYQIMQRAKRAEMSDEED